MGVVRYQHVCFDGYGYALPDNVVSSIEIEQELASVYERFGVHEGRLELMTGIRERRFWDEGALPSDGSTLAGRRALAAAGVGPGEIECLIHTSVSRDYLEPATASVVHNNLGITPDSMFFDISNACLGFLNGILTVGNLIELGQIKRGLVVAGESSRQLVQTTIRQLLEDPNLTKPAFKAAFSSLTIGSGAVALVLSHDSVARSEHRLLGGAVRAATQHNHLCRGSADTGFGGNVGMSMQTHAETLLHSGCALAVETWSNFSQALGWTPADLARTFSHQVGAAHRDRLYESIGLDVVRDFSTFEFLGNVGSVSAPITMALGIERDPPKPGEQMAMLGIGSGLGCVMLGTRW